MKKKGSAVFRVVALLFLFSCLLPLQVNAAVINVSGNIAVNTTWTAGNIYVATDTVIVNSGVTLTIEPGAIIKFANWTALDVYGTLTANGAEGSKIYFTDYRDDTAGGDTNGDGGATTPAAGWWRGVRVLNGGTATMNYCVVRYAVGYNDGPGYDYGSVSKTGTGGLTLTNSEVSNASGSGVWLYDTSADVTLTGNTLHDNGDYGLLIQNASGAVTVTDNTFYGNADGQIYIATNSPNINIGSGNSISGAINIPGGNISQNTTWEGGYVYYVTGVVTVDAGITLTIEPGAIIKFAQNTQLDVNGTLNAIGTGANKIYFTDYRDDTVGGDTNGDGGATTPAAGWWRGVRVLNGGTATMNYCVVRYAVGYNDGPGYDYGSVSKTGTGGLTLTNSEVSNASGSGVWLYDTSATATISGNVIRNNATGLKIEGSPSSVVDIRDNTISDNTSQGIYCQGSSPAIRGNTISGSGSQAIYVQDSASKPYISRNTISANAVGIASVSGANPALGGAYGLGNNFVSNTGLAVSNDTSSVTVNARYNWWGSSSCPAVGGANGVSQYVDYSFCLTEGYSSGLGNGLIAFWKGDNNALDSIGNNHGAAQGGMGYAEGKVSQAFSFTGSDQQALMTLNTALPTGNSARTVSAWFKSGSQTQQNILHYGLMSDTQGIYLNIDNTSDCIGSYSSGFKVLLGTWGTGTNLCGTTDVADGLWHHVAATYDQTTWKLYVDGSLQNETSAITTGTGADTTLSIGHLKPGAYAPFQFVGQIDETRIYNRALSALEISTLAGTKPDAFTFTDQTDIGLNTSVESNVITVAGITNPAAISISGNSGQYSISTNNGSSWGNWTSSNGTVNLNDQVKVRQTSSSNHSTRTDTVLVIGGVSDTFSVTTVAAPVLYTLTVNKSGAGSGSVTVNTGSLSWAGNTGTGSYESGATVELTAEPDDGFVFGGWSGACSANSGTCTVTMNAAREVTALFNGSADFSGAPTSGYVPMNVSFTDLSAHNPTSWAWTFGDGGTSSQQNPVHTYRANGTYTVTLTATGDGGAVTMTKTGYITVGPGACLNPPYKIGGNLVNYPTIQVAYDATNNNETMDIQALEFIVSGGMMLDILKTVTLKGGYGCDFASNPGYTVISDKITIKDGKVTMENLIIK